jgi:histidinol-phosphate aminotransferase
MAHHLARCSVVERVFPSQANYICVKVRNREMVVRRCMEAGCLVADVSQSIPGAIRIAVGLRAENDALLALLASMAPHDTGSEFVPAGTAMLEA